MNHEAPQFHSSVLFYSIKYLLVITTQLYFPMSAIPHYFPCPSLLASQCYLVLDRPPHCSSNVVLTLPKKFPGLATIRSPRWRSSRSAALPPVVVEAANSDIHIPLTLLLSLQLLDLLCFVCSLKFQGPAIGGQLL